MNIPQRKRCGSIMGDIISSVSYKYATKDSVFNDVVALSDLHFDGSKHSLAIALGNCSAQKSLRAYGLPRTLTHIVMHFPELHECEELNRIGQILILHDNNLLIRIANTSPEAEKNVIQVEMQAVLKELENQDSKTHAQLVQERITSEAEELFSYWVGLARKPWSPVAKRAFTATALGLTVGAVTYCMLK